MSIVDIDQHLNLDEEVARYRRRAVIALQSAFLIGAGILFVLLVVSDGIEYTILAGMLSSALSIALALRQRLGYAALILGAQFLVIPTLLSISALGTFDAAMLIFPAGMLAVSVVAKPRATAVFSLATLLCAGLVAHATLNHTLGNNKFSGVTEANHVDVITTLVVIGFCGIVATYVSIILTGLLRLLANHQATLEQRIERRTRELAQSNDELRVAMKTLDSARAELVRGEKLAGLGSLVAGVAHELNTPIGNTAMAASALEDNVAQFAQLVESGNLRKSDLTRMIGRFREGTDLIVRATHRARDLIASFKQVAVDQTSDRRRQFTIGDLVDDVLRSLRPSFSGKKWTVDSHVEGEIRCDGYPGPLGQILTNLVQNAIVHGFSGREHGHIQVTARPVANDCVEIAVADDGNGIAPEAMGKIFDPFFTTRLGQGGSGLGLTIVHNLATAGLGGRIEVESELGKGTRFIVTVPKVAPKREGRI